MLFFGYFSCLIVAFTAVAMWLMSSFNPTALEKRHHPRPPIDQTVTAEDIAHLHLQATKEASAAAPKDDVAPVKHHKPKLIARRRNDYAYGNPWGNSSGNSWGNSSGNYAQAYRNDPRGFFIH
jgi:hypothetical protein